MFFKEILCTFFSSRSQELKKKKFFGKPDSFFSIHWKLLMMMMMMANIEEKNIQVMIGKKNNFQSSLNDFVCVCVWVFACWFIIIGIIFFFLHSDFFLLFLNEQQQQNPEWLLHHHHRMIYNQVVYVKKIWIWKMISLCSFESKNFFFLFFFEITSVSFFCFRLFSFTMNNIKATKKKKFT